MRKLFIILFLIFFISCEELKSFKKEDLSEKVEDCKNGMCYIPAGNFMMGCNSSVDSECGSDEKPYHKVYLDGYYMDQYEVTVKEFKKCVDTGGCSSENYKTKNRYSFCNYGNSSRDDHPMNCVNWYGANEYCKWAGKRLPTEAEWEKGARGTDGRIYPWGNEKVSCYYAVMEEDSIDGCGKDSTWSVGSKRGGKSPYGLYDMSGNVWEWVKDYYDYYKNSSSRNPQGGKSGKYHVVRGGGWYLDRTYYFRASSRLYNSPAGMYRNSNGFRCVKSK